MQREETSTPGLPPNVRLTEEELVTAGQAAVYAEGYAKFIMGDAARRFLALYPPEKDPADTGPNLGTFADAIMCSPARLSEMRLVCEVYSYDMRKTLHDMDGITWGHMNRVRLAVFAMRGLTHDQRRSYKYDADVELECYQWLKRVSENGWTVRTLRDELKAAQEEHVDDEDDDTIRVTASRSRIESVLYLLETDSPDCRRQAANLLRDLLLN